MLKRLKQEYEIQSFHFIYQFLFIQRFVSIVDRNQKGKGHAESCYTYNNCGKHESMGERVQVVGHIFDRDIIVPDGYRYISPFGGDRYEIEYNGCLENGQPNRLFNQVFLKQNSVQSNTHQYD